MSTQNNFRIFCILYKNRRMSITISNCDEICASPSNTSKSKMLYSFSKSERFPKRRQILCDKFYNLQSTISKRKAGFGYGHKYDFTKNVPNVPSPDKYQIQSQFSPNAKKGFGFGYGRSEMEITGPFVQTKKNKNPGPGTYPHHCQLSETTFTLRGKNYQEDKEKLKVPGPGTYPVTYSINQNGKYFLSKFKNSCVRNFNTTLGRLCSGQNKFPGPGSYSSKNTDLSPQGKYFSSKMHSSLARKFGNSQRSNIARKINTPGPGNYKLPSQFGHYMSKNAVKPMTQGSKRIQKENRC